MEVLESSIREYLEGKVLTNIEFYTVEENYFSPNPESTWIINAGIELSFNEVKFSFAWREEKDFFDKNLGPIQELVGEIPIGGLEARNIMGVDQLVGSKIEKVEIKWNFYQEYDENFELNEEKKYMPKELLISFENQSVLQLSSVHFEINGSQLNLSYDSQGQLLVGLNEKFDIAEDMEE